MQIKNKIILYFFIIFFLSTSILKGDEFNISAKEIIFDKNNNIVTGKGQVEITDKDGKVIKSDNVKVHRIFFQKIFNLNVLEGYLIKEYLKYSLEKFPKDEYLESLLLKLD